MTCRPVLRESRKEQEQKVCEAKYMYVIERARDVSVRACDVSVRAFSVEEQYPFLV